MSGNAALNTVTGWRVGGGEGWLVGRFVVAGVSQQSGLDYSAATDYAKLPSFVPFI